MKKPKLTHYQNNARRGKEWEKKENITLGGNVSKIYSSMIFWTSFVSKIMKITLQKLTKETHLFF